MVVAVAGENTGQLLLDYHPAAWRDGFQFVVDDMQSKLLGRIAVLRT